MRQTGSVLGSLCVALLLAAALGGCATMGASGAVYVRTAPPPPIVEARGVAPGPGHVWIAGYHRWERNRYVWVPGHWTKPPRHSSVWVPGHWDRTSRGYVWVAGRWK
ncbi:MAG: hypothetical protein AB1806_17505 [Acidobacteriota bacterium]